MLPDGTATPLAPGQIRDSNRHAMIATLRRDGFEAVDLGLAVDTEEAVTAGLERALLSTCDAVLTTGGVSKGEFDLCQGRARKAAAAAGVEGGGVHELSVAIRPAKPLVISWLPSAWRLALSPASCRSSDCPGNPVSSLVSYRRSPCRCCGCSPAIPPAPPATVPAVALAEILRRHRDGKTHLVRVEVRWSDDGRLEPVPRRPDVAPARRHGGGERLAIVPDGDGLGRGRARLDVILFGPIEPHTRP